MKSSSLPIIEQVSREMRIQNYSQRTIDSYTTSLKRLMRYKAKPVEQITITVVRVFYFLNFLSEN